VTHACPWCYQPVAYGSAACAYCRRPLQQAYPQQPQQAAWQQQQQQQHYAHGQAQPQVHAQWQQQQQPQVPQVAPPPPPAKKPSGGLKFALIGLASLVVIGGGVAAAVMLWPSEEGTGLGAFVPETVGDFTRGKAKREKKLGPGITDALTASYKGKGKDVEVKLYACASQKKAQETYQRLVDETKKKLSDKPLSIESADIQEGGKNIGELKHMIGATQVIVWYEGELAATVAGPFDAASRFFKDCPRCPAFQTP
jgi:hypothetical protein